MSYKYLTNVEKNRLAYVLTHSETETGKQTEKHTHTHKEQCLKKTEALKKLGLT